MSSIGKSGARSWGPMGLPVPGWSTGGAGVLRSAWMLYHLVGMSRSSRTIFVRLLSATAIAGLLRVDAAGARKSAPTIQKRFAGCQMAIAGSTLALRASPPPAAARSPIDGLAPAREERRDERMLLRRVDGQRRQRQRDGDRHVIALGPRRG